MNITVITPSIRPEMLEIVDKCLKRQTFKDYEWLVVSPNDYGYGTWVLEPFKKDGDYYKLNGAWNEGFRFAHGELFVSIVDGMWFPPDTLERLWNHYMSNPMSCIGLIGHQYERIENDKPEGKVWHDPREKSENFYQIPPYDLEWTLSSIPLRGIIKIGGMDEKFDKFPAWSEKEASCRLEKIGYKFFIDQSIEYRAIHHPRLNDRWEELYPKSTAYFMKCYKDIQEGKRLYLDNFRKSDILN